MNRDKEDPNLFVEHSPLGICGLEKPLKKLGGFIISADGKSLDMGFRTGEYGLAGIVRVYITTSWPSEVTNVELQYFDPKSELYQKLVEMLEGLD